MHIVYVLYSESDVLGTFHSLQRAKKTAAKLGVRNGWSISQIDLYRTTGGIRVESPFKWEYRYGWVEEYNHHRGEGMLPL